MRIYSVLSKTPCVAVKRMSKVRKATHSSGKVRVLSQWAIARLNQQQQ